MGNAFKTKFCWLPTETYESEHCRNGFAWLKFVFVADNGKAYKHVMDFYNRDIKSRTRAAASKVLRSPNSSKAAKTARGSALTQRVAL